MSQFCCSIPGSLRLLIVFLAVTGSETKFEGNLSQYMRADCHTCCPEQAIRVCLYLWCFPQIRPSTKLTCFPQRMEKYSCVERKSYLQERSLFASSPVRSLRSVTWLRRALIPFSIPFCTSCCVMVISASACCGTVIEWHARRASPPSC